MALVLTGTPFVGYCALANGSIGPTPFTLYTDPGNTAAYTLAAAGTTPNAERVYITNVTLSSNDATAAIVTLDTGSTGSGANTQPTTLLQAFLSATQVLQPIQIPPGVLRGIPGIARG